MYWDANVVYRSMVILPPEALISWIPVAPELWQYMWREDVRAGNTMHDWGRGVLPPYSAT